MSTCPCEGCDRPRHHDHAICVHHAWLLERDLAETPALVRELELTLARQHGAGPSDGGKNADTPLPFDLRASLALTRLRETLLVWGNVLDLALQPGDTTDAIAGFVLARHSWLVLRIDAHLAVTDIGNVCHHGWRVVQPSSRGRIALPDPCPDCSARMWATMHDLDDPRPNLVWCEGAAPGAERHEWRPEQWLRLGHRLGYGRTA